MSMSGSAMAPYYYLGIAILGEVVATSALKASEEFTKFWPSILVILGYIIAFYFLMLSLRTFPIGVAYAIWCGSGIILVSLIGYFFYYQKLDMPTILGIVLILAGTLIINLFSKNI